MKQPSGYLQRAIDRTGSGVLLEAHDAVWRAAYGDEAVDRAYRNVARRIAQEVQRDA